MSKDDESQRQPEVIYIRTPFLQQADSVDLEAIEARANAATEGPWEYAEGIYNDDLAQKKTDQVGSIVNEEDGWYIAAIEDVGDATAANATFLAHARTDIPVISALVRRLTAERDALQRQLRSAFITCESRPSIDERFVKIAFRSLEEAQALHKLLVVDLLSWLPADLVKEKG